MAGAIFGNVVVERGDDEWSEADVGCADDDVVVVGDEAGGRFDERFRCLLARLARRAFERRDCAVTLAVGGGGRPTSPTPTAPNVHASRPRSENVKRLSARRRALLPRVAATGRSFLLASASFAAGSFVGAACSSLLVAAVPCDGDGRRALPGDDSCERRPRGDVCERGDTATEPTNARKAASAVSSLASSTFSCAGRIDTEILRRGLRLSLSLSLSKMSA